MMSRLFKTIRFATYGGEPKGAHRIPLGLLWQTQTHSLPKVANTYGGEGSEPNVWIDRKSNHLKYCMDFLDLIVSYFNS